MSLWPVWDPIALALHLTKATWKDKGGLYAYAYAHVPMPDMT